MIRARSARLRRVVAARTPAVGCARSCAATANLVATAMPCLHHAITGMASELTRRDTSPCGDLFDTLHRTVAGLPAGPCPRVVWGGATGGVRANRARRCNGCGGRCRSGYLVHPHIRRCRQGHTRALRPAAQAGCAGAIPLRPEPDVQRCNSGAGRRGHRLPLGGAPRLRAALWREHAPVRGLVRGAHAEPPLRCGLPGLSVAREPVVAGRCSKPEWTAPSIESLSAISSATIALPGPS